ncbi:MAG: hypothetical protein J6Z49_08345, partial [Kiritimatiellae bacterium]|nr:hypothetical protein [Kiritimatiellia bacterium]
DNWDNTPNPAGLIAACAIRYWDGHVDTFKTDASWTCTRNRGQFGEQDAPVQEFGPFAMRPWGLRPRGKDLYVSYSALSYLVSNAGLLSDTELRPDFETDGDLRYIHRRLDGRDIYFVGNRLDKPQTATCRFRVGDAKSIEWWDPLNGERESLSGWKCTNGVTEIELALGPGESGFVVAGRADPARRNGQAARCTRVVEGPWKVAFDPAWGGPEGEVEFKTLEDWTKRPEWGIQHYSGIATYRKTVTSKDAPTHISLGDVANLARVKLNGRDLGSVWCWPWRVAVPEGVWKDGENLLEIEVANLWLNRLIGDASLPAEKRLTRTTVNPHKPTDTLRKSGLFGPVKLENDER